MNPSPRFDLPGPALQVPAAAHAWPSPLADRALVTALPTSRALGVIDMTQTLWQLDLPRGGSPTCRVLGREYLPQVSVIAAARALATTDWRLLDLRSHPSEPWALVSGERMAEPFERGLWRIGWDGSPAEWLVRVPAASVLEVVALSHDGTWAAYWAPHGSRSGLYVQRLASPTAAPRLLTAELPDDVDLVWLADPPALAAVARGDADILVWYF